MKAYHVRRILLKIIGVGTLSIAILSMILSIAISHWPEYFKGRPTDYHILKYQYAQIESRQKKRNIVIGDSRGNCNINPVIFGDSWLNLSLPGSSTLEGYITLERHLRMGNTVDSLVIIYGMEYLEGNSWGLFENISVTFGFLENRDLDELEDIEIQSGFMYQKNRSTILPVMRLLQIDRRLRHAGFPLSYRKFFLKAVRNMTFNRQRILEKWEYILDILPRTGGHMLFGNKSDYTGLTLNSDPNSTFQMPFIKRHYLDRLLELASNKGIDVIMIPPPLNQTTFDKMKGSNYMKSSHMYLSDAFSRHPNARLLTEPSRFPNDCFNDNSGHLNEKGSGIYSRSLKDAIGRMSTLAGGGRGQHR
jgi:hypothetical protein